MQKGKTHIEWPGYDIKQSAGEIPVMLQLWGIWRTTSLFLGPLWLEVINSDRVLSMGQIELFKFQP